MYWILAFVLNMYLSKYAETAESMTIFLSTRVWDYLKHWIHRVIFSWFYYRRLIWPFKIWSNCQCIRAKKIRVTVYLFLQLMGLRINSWSLGTDTAIYNLDQYSRIKFKINLKSKNIFLVFAVPAWLRYCVLYAISSRVS